MALTLHKVLKDGSYTHEEFTRSSWESAMQDPLVAWKWGHGPGDCRHPVGAHWAELRRQGHDLTPSQHAKADLDDPTWVGSRDFKLEETIKVVPPPEPIIWPPESELNTWALCQLTTVCMDDAKDILRARRIEVPKAPEPRVDKRGQYSLF